MTDNQTTGPDGIDRCRRCGRCCSEKIVLDDEVVMAPAACKYLDLETMLCTKFADRFDLDVECLTVEQGIAAQAFPADCPYVQGRDDYVAPREDWWNVPEIVDLVESGQLSEELDRADAIMQTLRGRRSQESEPVKKLPFTGFDRESLDVVARGC